MKNLSIDMKNCLIKGKLENFSKLMDKSWYLKKTINPMATNKKIDKIYDLAKKAGAVGGKILGAGQNGYLLLYIESFNQSLLQTKFKKINLHNKIERINFSSDGLKYWKVLKMKILVTGGAGYIGVALVDLLLKKKHNVTVLDNFCFNQQYVFFDLIKNEKFNVINGDVRDKKLLKKLVKENEFIIPLAGMWEPLHVKKSLI